MYQTIFFDLDGTLLNTIDDLAATGNYVLKKMHKEPLAINQYKLLVGDGIPRLVERLLPLADEDIIQKNLHIFRQFYALHYNDHTGSYPGINDLLVSLKCRSIQLAVITNKADLYTQSLIKRHFEGVFDLVLGQTSAFSPKPCPESLLYAMRILRAEQHNSLFVGDSSNDIIVAHNAGISCCGITWGFRDKSELRNAGADYIVDTPEELLNIILADL